MLKIRRIRDTHQETDRTTIAEVQAIIRAQFPAMEETDVLKLPEQLTDPLKFQFVSELLVVEDGSSKVKGFALLLNAPDLGFAYLDTISTASGRSGSGIGTALYDAVRDTAVAMNAKGLFFECLPDDPKLSPNPKTRRQNASRLRFYERYGARPIMGTAYEEPIDPTTTDPPYLVFDGLDRFALPHRRRLSTIVEAILTRKYGDLCPPDYIKRVVKSFIKGMPRLRPPRYSTAQSEASDTAAPKSLPPPQPIALIVNDRHAIHHVRDRGYVEAPVRVAAIQRELGRTGLFETIPAQSFPDRWIKEVHDGSLVDYIRDACEAAPEKRSIYPYVFPVRNASRRPHDQSVLAGYWCIDTFTPINRYAYPAARHAVDCSLTAADEVMRGRPLAYALVRPPGHHAERKTFGGFCYFCNCAIAAQYLSSRGRVAILDIDYHHGNGQQDIFYERSDVLTVSIHGDPSFAYPYFTGFTDERGRGRGASFNLNLPLPEKITPDQHREALRAALGRIAEFKPAYLVVSLGLDTAKGDPTGTWSNQSADFHKMGELIGAAHYPTVVIQEGGYRVRTLGSNARHFFTGLSAGLRSRPLPRAKPLWRGPKRSAEDMSWRDSVAEADAPRIRDLVAGTDMFTPDEVEISVELVNERVMKGAASGYEFILAEDNGRLVGYACYGRTPATASSVDLYWIVVAADAQGHGIGRALLAKTETAARAAGGHRLYVDTSSRAAYEPTRKFYRRTGFQKIAELKDFYRPGDGKIIFMKEI